MSALPSVSALPSSSAHVLIVDDERHIAEMIQSLLGRYGYGAVLAESGEEALKVLAERDFDAIITDHYLECGQLNGLDLVMAVQAMDRKTPFFVATACVDDDILDSLRDHPLVRELFRKPFDIMVLLKHVSAAIEEAQARRANGACPVLDEPRERTVLGG